MKYEIGYYWGKLTQWKDWEVYHFNGVNFSSITDWFSASDFYQLSKRIKTPDEYEQKR